MKHHRPLPHFFVTLLVGALLLSPLSPPLFSQEAPKKDTTITISAKNMELREVMDLISVKLGKNIVVHTDVKTQVTAKLDKIDVTEALDIICKTHKLAWILEGNVIVIYSRELLVAEGQPRNFESESVTINNRPVKEIFNLINVSPLSGDQSKQSGGTGVSYTGGKIIFDDKDNTITIFDSRTNISAIKGLVGTLDRKFKSVLIEAKILNVDLVDEQKFGINWNFLGPNREVRMPFGAQSGGSTLKVVSDPFFIAGLNFTFDALIDAIGKKNTVKVLSSPRIAVVSGEEGKITVGQSVPYTTTTYSAQNSQPIQDTKFVQTGIKLAVTPTIFGQTVKLKIHPEVSKPKFTAAGQAPTVDTSEADTILIVGDGQTVVLGGLITEDSTKLNSGIPFIAQIPIIGILFSSSEFHNNRTELVVLINVKIQ